MQLATEMPRMSAEMRAEVESRLRTGCDCGHEVAQLTRRQMRHSVAVYLQCLGCGYALGPALSRAAHYFWQDYPEWDAGLSDAYLERQRQASPYNPVALREDYVRFLANDPRWKSLRQRVLHRANYQCEACLDATATQVHHVTYTQGRLPPAWNLRAVCRQCHDRLHDWVADAAQ